MPRAAVTFVVLVPASQEVGCAPEDALRLGASDPGGLGGLHTELERLAVRLMERGGAVAIGQPLIVPVPGDLAEAVEALRKVVTRVD